MRPALPPPAPSPSPAVSKANTPASKAASKADVCAARSSASQLVKQLVKLVKQLVKLVKQLVKLVWLSAHVPLYVRAGAQFTRVTSTQVQILTQRLSTKVQILTQLLRGPCLLLPSPSASLNTRIPVNTLTQLLRGPCPRRYSLYSLYQHKGTNTDAAPEGPLSPAPLSPLPLSACLSLRRRMPSSHLSTPRHPPKRFSSVSRFS